MKPVIGIFPSYNPEKKQAFLDNFYTEEIISSGGIPVILPFSDNCDVIEEALSHIDGLMLSGGVDIDPKYYGEPNSGKSVDISPIMDECEKIMIPAAMEKDLPILGVCRGMQALNVFCGGTLFQDLPSEHGYSVIHGLKEPETAFHSITVEKESPLSDAIGFGQHKVNSYHHQAVKNIAPCFSVAAIAEDGIVEAIYCKNKSYVLGVQWHPERDYAVTADSKKIIDGFIAACSKK